MGATVTRARKGLVTRRSVGRAVLLLTPGYPVDRPDLCLDAGSNQILSVGSELDAMDAKGAVDPQCSAPAPANVELIVHDPREPFAGGQVN